MISGFAAGSTWLESIEDFQGCAKVLVCCLQAVEITIRMIVLTLGGVVISGTLGDGLPLVFPVPILLIHACSRKECGNKINPVPQASTH